MSVVISWIILVDWEGALCHGLEIILDLSDALFCSADGMVLPRSGFTLGCELTVVRDEVMGLFM